MIIYITAIISILPNIIKTINDDFVILFKSKKVTFSNPYKDEFTVFVRVSTDNLNELSNDKLSKVNMLDSTNYE